MRRSNPSCARAGSSRGWTEADVDAAHRCPGQPAQADGDRVGATVFEAAVRRSGERVPTRYRASICRVRRQSASVAGRNRRLRKSMRHAPRGGGAPCHAAPLTTWRARGPGALQAPPKGREALDFVSATWYLRRRSVLGPRRGRMIEGAVKGEGRGGVPTRDRERALC